MSTDNNNNYSVQCSKYVHALTGTEKCRYLEKINNFGKDPYLMKYDENMLPKNISFLEIYDYLVNGKSYYTKNEFKAYKSLESYKLYESGWVQYMAGLVIQNDYLVLGKVHHSQSLNLPVLMVWVHIAECGSVVTGHCTCVAGLGEVCTHIGTVLFALNAFSTNISDNEIQSVTDVKAYWLVPSCKNSLQLLNEKIKYTMKPKTDAKSKDNNSCSAPLRNSTINILKKIASKGKQPVAMLGCDEFLSPEQQKEDVEIKYFLNIYMANIYKSHMEGRSLDEMMTYYTMYDFQITDEEKEVVEINSRSQAKCEYWHKLRLGRITASIFKQCVRARIKHAVPKHLLNRVCYPADDNLQTPAIIYGRRYEKVALRVLLAENKKKHEDLLLKSCGFMIMKEKSFYGASPDAIWSCKCCGTFPVEIKCPFNLLAGSFETYLGHKNCPLRCSSSNNHLYEMSTDHPYYFQLQLQGYICKANFGYFYIYSKNKRILCKVPINNNFVEEQMKKSDYFFKYIIFPELVGKYYTNK